MNLPGSLEFLIPTLDSPDQLHPFFGKGFSSLGDVHVRSDVFIESLEFFGEIVARLKLLLASLHLQLKDLSLNSR